MSAICSTPRNQLGLFRRRLRPDHQERQRHHRLQPEHHFHGHCDKKADYIPHHQPFQYYASTQNLTHTRPTSPSTVGIDGDPANHQYDIHDFYDAINAGNFPTVSFLKAPGYQDGHAGYSDPLDEQTFVATVINFLQKHKDWAEHRCRDRLRRFRWMV